MFPSASLVVWREEPHRDRLDTVRVPPPQQSTVVGIPSGPPLHSGPPSFSSASGAHDGAAAPQDDAELAIMARCEELFEKYDEDNSGSIDSAEFSALCFDMGLAFEDEADKELVLSMLDTDGDGSVSLDEFKVWWLANKDTFFVENYSDNPCDNPCGGSTPATAAAAAATAAAAVAFGAQPPSP